MQANYANALCHFNITPSSVAVLAPCAWRVFVGKTTHGKRGEMGGACGQSRQSENVAVFGRRISLSLSLSRCSHFLASLWAKFKRLFYSFYRNFILSYRKFFLFHRSFNSSFYLQKSFFRILCFFEIFKSFVYGYFANAQYDKVCQYNKIDDKKSVWYDKTSQHNKFGLLSKNDGQRKRTLPFGKDGYFHSNRFQKFEKFNTKESK